MIAPRMAAQYCPLVEADQGDCFAFERSEGYADEEFFLDFT